MRSRNIKPGFFKNEDLAQCTPFTRLLFIGLWCMADRDGRLEKRPLRIKAEIFPYDTVDIHGNLTVLERRGFIKTYSVDGSDYLHVVHFKDHQSPHHTEAKSKLPDISDGCDLTVNSPLDLREYPPDSLIPDSLIPDSLIPDSLIPDSLIPDSSLSENAAPVKPAQPTSKKISDEEWIEQIKSNPAYKGINFDIEIGKAQAWCMTNNRKCSRKFLLNWFNRAEKPIQYQGNGVAITASKGAMGALQRAAALREKQSQEATNEV